MQGCLLTVPAVSVAPGVPVVILSAVPGGELAMLTAATRQIAAGENHRSVCPCFPTGCSNTPEAPQHSVMHSAEDVWRQMTSLRVRLMRWLG